jgi:hypothetical protein
MAPIILQTSIVTFLESRNNSFNLSGSKYCPNLSPLYAVINNILHVISIHHMLQWHFIMATQQQYFTSCKVRPKRQQTAYTLHNTYLSEETFTLSLVVLNELNSSNLTLHYLTNSDQDQFSATPRDVSTTDMLKITIPQNYVTFWFIFTVLRHTLTLICISVFDFSKHLQVKPVFNGTCIYWKRV